MAAPAGAGERRYNHAPTKSNICLKSRNLRNVKLRLQENVAPHAKGVNPTVAL
jgi:hypothetical protein